MSDDTRKDTDAADGRQSMREAALAYAARGWAVLPLHSPDERRGCTCTLGPKCEHPGKHPRTLNGFADATTDEAAVRRWWGMWPTANIGIAPGASGLVVFDADGPDGEQAARGLGLTAEPTLCARSGRADGGTHYYFRRPPFKVSNKKPHPKLDVRGDAGLIVAPPSLHASGARYAWLPGADEPLPLPPKAEGVLRALQGRQSTPSATGEPTEGAVRRGGRNDALTSLAGALRRWGANEATIRAALETANAEHCTPPLADDEVTAIARSVARYAPGGDDVREEPAELRPDAAWWAAVEADADARCGSLEALRDHGMVPADAARVFDGLAALWGGDVHAIRTAADHAALVATLRANWLPAELEAAGLWAHGAPTLPAGQPARLVIQRNDAGAPVEVVAYSLLTRAAA